LSHKLLEVGERRSLASHYIFNQKSLHKAVMIQRQQFVLLQVFFLRKTGRVLKALTS